MSLKSKNDNPKITVYVVSYNYGKFLGDAIESVLRQTLDNWELLIINDNSTDNTSQVMNLYKGDERVRLFTTSGIGLPAICNLAIKEARGKYLIRLDGDDIFEENILLVLGNHLDNNTETALVFPDYYLIDEFGEVFSLERRQKVYANNHVLNIPANGACTLIRRDIIQKVGGYREDLGAQDGYDLWSKITNKYKCANINLPLFYYRRHGSNLTNNFHRLLDAQRAIKRDSAINKIANHKPITAIIPCRQNYNFCTNLWNQKIKGKTLLQRDIEVCLSSSVFDQLIVGCDNPEAQTIVGLFNDPRLSFFLRDSKDTILSKNLAFTLEKIISPIDLDWNGITVVSYIQTPFVTKETLEEAVFTLIANEADSAFGVEETNSPLYKKGAHGLQPINPRGELSSDFTTIYRECSTALATKNKNLKTGSLTGSSIVNFIVSNEEGFFINSERTLKIAKIIAEEE